MKESLAYPAVLIGLLSFPALFFAGLYLVAKKVPPSPCPPWKRWAAAAAYSAAVCAAWWIIYSHGKSLQRLLPLPHLTFAYSAYALLPLSAAAGVLASLGALASALRAARTNARH